jgi:3' exoribonuclease, RNase T-like
VIAFLDTEFTNLLVPRLLSIGIVVPGRIDGEFYAEVTDEDRLLDSSRFVQQTVLTQFGLVANAACSYAAMGARAASFFRDLQDALGPEEFVDVAFESPLDWTLLLRAMEDCRPQEWQRTRQSLRPMNVFNIDGFAAGAAAADEYFKSQALATLSRHHALCDARALRIAFTTAMSDQAERGGTVGGSKRSYSLFTTA